MTIFSEVVPALLNGTVVTVGLTLGALLFMIPISVAGGVIQYQAPKGLKILSKIYIEFFRGTSVLVQLFWFFFALPLLGVELGPLLTGIMVLSLNLGAYGSVVVHGALQAVPQTQKEAALALNLNAWQRLIRIMIPQAIPLALPPMGNLMIELLKNTSLVSLITITELTFQGQILNARLLEPTFIYSGVLLIYFALAGLMTFGVKYLEKKLSF